MFFLKVHLFALLQVAASMVAAVFVLQDEIQPVLLSEVEGIPNPVRITKNIISGGRPEAEQGIESLKALGVTTIVCVDATAPEVARFQKAGIECVHIPLRYDGVDRKQQAQLAVALGRRDQTIYVHCHHGKQRAPMAVAVGLRLLGKCEAEEATRILQVCGTGKEYQALWQAVEQTQPQSQSTLRNWHESVQLVSVADADPRAAVMASVGTWWEELESISESQATVEKRESAAQQKQVEHLLLMLRESARELGRRETQADLKAEFEEFESAIARIQLDAESGEIKASDLQRLRNACVRCHESFRQ